MLTMFFLHWHKNCNLKIGILKHLHMAMWKCEGGRRCRSTKRGTGMTLLELSLSSREGSAFWTSLGCMLAYPWKPSMDMSSSVWKLSKNMFGIIAEKEKSSKASYSISKLMMEVWVSQASRKLCTIGVPFAA
eukprot:550195-Ditylum_brightwellii.AAC.1